LDDASNQAEFHFVITYSDQELRTYSKMMAGRYARAQNEGTVFGILLAAILLLGLAVLVAFKLGWVEPSAVRPCVVHGILRVSDRRGRLLFCHAGVFS
jgi:hypothetical protein